MKKAQGFTLIELLVVISIISLLSSVVLASLNSARDKGKVAAGQRFAQSLDHALADEPILFWNLDEGSGAVATDTSRNGNDGAINGALGSEVQWVSGIYGGGLKFTGINSYVTRNVSISGTSGTIAFWVKDPLSASGDYLFRSDANYRTYFRVAGGSIFFTKGNPAQTITVSTPKSGVWTHLAMEWWQDGGSVMHLSAYVNGALAGTTTFTDTSMGSYAVLGAFSTSGTQNAAGTFDQVRIYSRPLTALGIYNLYTSEAPRFKLADGK